MSVIKITSFKRILNPKNPEQTRQFTINKDPILINVLLFSETQNSEISSFEKWIRSNHKERVNLMKMVDKKSIIPTIKTVLQKKHRKTYVVTTQYLTNQLESLIKANQSKQLFDLFFDLKFMIFVDKIQYIDPKNFWIKDVSLITSKIEEIQKHIGDQVSALEHTESQDASSLNSEDQAAFEQQFIKKWSPISLPKSSPNKNGKQGEIIFHDVPGVGSYDVKNDLKFKGSLSGTFSKQGKLKQ